MTTYNQEPNIIVFNAFSRNDTNDNKIAEYISYRNTVIVDNPTNYYLKINRFYTSDLLLPLMVLNPTSLSVTIDATSTGGTISRVFVPIINNSSLSSSFGFIYDIGVFAQMVDQALSTAHINSGAPNNAPRFLYDGTGRFQFVIDQQYQAQGTEIWLNNELGQKLSSFILYFNSFVNDDPLTGDGRVYRLTYYPNPNNTLASYPNLPPVGPGYPVYNIVQPYDSIFLITEVKRLVVTTSQMPTLREYYPSLSNDTVNRTLGILFSVPVSDSFTSFSEKIEYDPQIIKLIDLVSQEPLNTIDYRVNFELDDGRLLPVFIEPGKSFGISFSFEHRSLHDNAYTYNKLDL